MTTVILLFGFVVVVKFLINLSRYLACKKYHKIYDVYLKKPEWKFEEIQPQIVKLFKEAEIEDNAVAHVEYLGFNQVLATSEISVMRNIGNTRGDVVQSVTAMFHRAKGIYRSRMLDSINPLYWLLFIFFLPKNLFQYIGASPESTLVKLVQVIYWFLAGITGFFFGVFGEEINAYIKECSGPKNLDSFLVFLRG